jgi:hypothetical protein
VGRICVVPVSVRRSISIVRLALVTSVMCTPPFGPAGQVPDQPRVDVAERQVAGLGRARAPSTLSSIQLDLRPGEVGGERQADLGAEAVLAAVGRQLVARSCRSACPARRARCGSARRCPVPDHRGLALVGDADRGDVVVARRPPCQRAAITSWLRAQISLASCSTQPGFGKICSCSFWSTEPGRSRTPRASDRDRRSRPSDGCSAPTPALLR